MHPTPTRTGAPSLQPPSGDTLVGWAVTRDIHGAFHHHDCGFLDAPDTLPRGGVRALSCGGALTLGIAHTARVPARLT